MKPRKCNSQTREEQWSINRTWRVAGTTVTPTLTGSAIRRAVDSFLDTAVFAPFWTGMWTWTSLGGISWESLRYLVGAHYFHHHNINFTMENTIGVIYIAWIEKKGILEKLFWNCKWWPRNMTVMNAQCRKGCFSRRIPQPGLQKMEAA